MRPNSQPAQITTRPLRSSQSRTPSSEGEFQNTAVCAAAWPMLQSPDVPTYVTQVRGVVLLNGAGRFDDLEEEGGVQESTDEVSVTALGEVAQKACLSPGKLSCSVCRVQLYDCCGVKQETANLLAECKLVTSCHCQYQCGRRCLRQWSRQANACRRPESYPRAAVRTAAPPTAPF